MKILHIITGLSLGGAENTLLKLCLNSNNNDIEHVIVSLTNVVVIGEKLSKIIETLR